MHKRIVLIGKTGLNKEKRESIGCCLVYRFNWSKSDKAVAMVSSMSI
ncbi:MAG: hypothetical protein PHF73_12510 [Massilibacteroides sp.]|nr:hypothetical protein [Massilibacteroides sp.]